MRHPSLAILCGLAAGIAIASPCIGTAFAQSSRGTVESAPAGEVSSGQRVTGHTRTKKASAVKTSPEQPAPATRQSVQPSQRLQDEHNQIKEQVAPTPDAPVKPGSAEQAARKPSAR